MFRSTLLLSLLLCTAIGGLANVGFSWVLNFEKIEIWVRGDWGSPENREKADILGRFVSDYNKSYRDNALRVVINIDPNDSTTSRYRIKFSDNGNIVLDAVDLKFNPIECITLIDYAVNNKNYITDVNKRIDFCGITKWKKKDSIWENTINRILITHKPNLDKILSKRYYAWRSYLGYNGQLLDYYYQNNKYTIIKLIDNKRPEFKGLDQLVRLADTIGTPVIALDDIYEIAGDSVNGYLIFKSIDTFYYYQKHLTSPYPLPLLRKIYIGRERIKNVVRKGNSIIIPVDVYRTPYHTTLDLASNKIQVDSTTIKEDLWDEIYAVRAVETLEIQKQEKKLARIASLKQHKIYSIIILISLVIVNGILIIMSFKKSK